MPVHKPKIGAHVSIAGKLANGISKAVEIGAECIQIFGASPQQWAVRGHTQDNIKEFKKAQASASIEPVYLHGAYLVNLCCPDAAIREKSEVNLAEHLKIADAIGAEGLIFHVGSGKEMPKDDAFDYVVSAMKRILLYARGRAQLVIENSAGGGQKIGATPEDIGELIRRIGSPRVKVCIDTQHSFAAGLIEKYDTVHTAAFIQRLDRAFGLENLVALHVNDSKTLFNSRHDRHENLGEGYIGLAGFRVLAKQKELSHAAWILEVPGFTNEGPDKKNVDLLKSCFR